MNAKSLWSRILISVGGIAMLLGVVDPLEGSVVILAGSILVFLATVIRREERRSRNYWAVTLILIGVGVAAMFALSAVGGIGGESGHSWWWVILLVPYPVGVLMGLGNLLVRLVRYLRGGRGRTA